MSDDHKPPPDPIPSELVQEDESFAEIVQEFVDALGERLAALRRAADTQDLIELRTLAHQLRGGAGGCGYPSITAQAAELEQHALAGETAAIQHDLDELQKLVARVVLRA